MDSVTYRVKAPFLSFIKNLIDSKHSDDVTKTIRILDVGCGDGSFCRLLDADYHNRVKLTGIDPGDDIALAIEQSNNRIEFLKDTFMDYAGKVQEASFDMIIFTKSLHHCPDEPKITVERARQLLTPNGLFVAEELWTHTIDDDERSHRWFFDRVDLLHATGTMIKENVRKDFVPALDTKLAIEERWRIILSGCRDHTSAACKQGILDVFGPENTRITENVAQLREFWTALGLKDDEGGKAAMTELIQQEARAVSENQIKGIGILFVCENTTK
ncbi:S-adenosyl-L-methionine-dependent methyltransferase [Lichtheimia hyalospora FSU 10163]|nr:S-adenosyl-L-methionine-dependent methyltransferase [Lichtheimia hyalospora FSU 10163]